MSDNQARYSRDDVYDHEHEEPRSGRRRRPVADWGVGDDVFEHMPRNRFPRAAEGPPRERRFSSHDGAERRAPQGDTPRGRVEDGRRTIVIGRPEDVPSEIAAITADRDLGELDAADAAEAAATPEQAGEPRRPAEQQPPPSERRPTAERRTVRIGGRPEGSLEAARFHREHGSRRPPRTAHERLGTRPERLAMWAVALGLLLIVIAILTAG